MNSHWLKLNNIVPALFDAKTMDVYSWTKVRPLFMLLHRGPDNSPLLIIILTDLFILEAEALTF